MADHAKLVDWKVFDAREPRNQVVYPKWLNLDAVQTLTLTVHSLSGTPQSAERS